MKISYETDPRVCSNRIDLEIEEGIIREVRFHGGCPGNLQAISLLVRGKKASEVAALLKGNRCGNKATSCADQLALALEEAEKKSRSK